jgi:hypothetical protein
MSVIVNGEKLSRARYKPYRGLGAVPRAITARKLKATAQNPNACRTLDGADL